MTHNNEDYCMECGTKLTSENTYSSEFICEKCWDKGWNKEFEISEDGQVDLKDI